jgi:glycosyltransferase involved in cell wall biosynthesis
MKKTKPMRVCILVNDLLHGGAQRIILDIAKNYDRECFDLSVVYLKDHALFGEQSYLDADVQGAGVTITGLSGARRFSLREFRALYRYLRTEKPDVLHTFLPYAGIVGRVAGRLAGVPRIVSTQCNLPIAYKPFVYWFDRATLPLASAWTGATESIERSYGGSSEYFSEEAWEQGRRHFSIVAGVDLPRFDKRVKSADRAALRKSIGIAPSDTLILMIARLVSWKGNEDLVRAAALLPRSAYIIIVGWGPQRARLEGIAKELGIARRVHFLGQRSDVPELLAAADVYVQAHCRAPDGSMWEGPNTSQMEAAAARIPSVSTAVPHIERLIEDGVTGTLARPSDPQDLARAVHRVMDDPERAARLAMAARARVLERYSAEAMTRAYEGLWRHAAAK